jgi:hypothetical protein
MTITELLIIARIIKNATAEDENSAIRVGGLLEEIVKYLHAVESGTTGGGGGGLWGTIEGLLSDQTDLNTELKKLDKVKNADQIVTDAGFIITFVSGDIYAFPQYKGVRTLVNKEDTSDNGYYKFIEEVEDEFLYELITPTPTFLTVSNDLTFGQGVFYPELMSVNGTPRRWKQITQTLDKIRNADEMVTDDGFTITWVSGNIYAFPQYKGNSTLINKDDTYGNGYYVFIKEETTNEYWYELITPTPIFVTVSHDLTFGQGVYYPSSMSATGVPLRWKQITEGGYTPPAPTELITLTEEESVYYVSDATPSVIAVFAETTGTIVLPVDEEPDTPTANKAVTIIITGGSGDIEVNSTVYEAGQTLFLFYIFADDVWTVNVAIDPVIPDIKDLFVSKKTDDFEFQNTTIGGAVVGETYITQTNLGMAQGALFFLYLPNIETYDYNEIGIYQYIGSEEVVEGTFLYTYQCLILGQDLNIVRVANDKVYHNQYNGTDLSTLEFREIQETVIEEIQVNGTPLEVTDKSVNINTTVSTDGVTVQGDGVTTPIALTEEIMDLIYAGL